MNGRGRMNPDAEDGHLVTGNVEPQFGIGRQHEIKKCQAGAWRSQEHQRLNAACCQLGHWSLAGNGKTDGLTNINRIWDGFLPFHNKPLFLFSG